jgi:hypothetical protein
VVLSGANRNQIRADHIGFLPRCYDERSEFFAFNKSVWGEVLQNLKQVVESQRS